MQEGGNAEEMQRGSDLRVRLRILTMDSCKNLNVSNY